MSRAIVVSRQRLLSVTIALVSLVLAAPLVARALTSQNPFATKPGKEHELLQKFAGRWNAKFTLSFPGAPPTDSKAVEVGELLGGLWLVARYDDPNMLGEHFSGVQVLGYDTAKKKYVAVWADSQTAQLEQQEGTWDEATKTLTLIGESRDPATGQPSTSKSIERWIDADHRTSTLLAPGPDGKEMEIFRIEYARAK